MNPVLERAMDRILILHADHEQNASTSTVRTAGSSGANPFACIAAGIASLWGPAHGGANEAALKMLEEIKTVEHIPEFIKRAKDKNDSFRLMGFGHRVYKNYDPRATVMRETCHEVLKELNKKDDNLLQVAMELEHIALNDPYFIEKKLYPNVDFYSGIILKAMGIPSSMFTVIFAIARTIGWIAHWNEMHDEGIKIARPRQLYTGYAERDFKSQLKTSKPLSRLKPHSAAPSGGVLVISGSPGTNKTAATTVRYARSSHRSVRRARRCDEIPEAKQRAVMPVVIRLPARLVGKARHRQQCLRQAAQRLWRQILRFVLRRQFGLPQDFGAQIIAQSGKKRLVEQHAPSCLRRNAASATAPPHRLPSATCPTRRGRCVAKTGVALFPRAARR